MTVHLIKMSVGSESVEGLKAFQERRFEQHGMIWHLTRHTPRRREEVLDGGSIYWIFQGAIRARNRILDIDTAENPDGETRCRFVLEPKLIATEAQPRRPHQGWRYFEIEDAPADASGSGRGRRRGTPPPEMAAELRELGLL